MANVTIYTTNICPYCDRAKELLKSKNIEFNEINAEDINIRKEMIAKAGGRRTVPQIFINDKHVGGCDDLYELNDKGELDKIFVNFT